MNKRRKVKITDLIINTSNARFINALNKYDEKFAIEELCNDKNNHIYDLLNDIALNDISPNLSPIIMDSPIHNGKFDVMDGNRRLTCVKLLLQYKDNVDEFSIPKLIKNTIKNLKMINVNEEIECLWSDDEVYVNSLLEKLHTHNTGVSTVQWTPIAQERHNYKKGKLTRVNALVRFLETSKYRSEEIINNINKDKWVSKFERFINNNNIIYDHFGFKFSKDFDEIIMFIDEQEIVKGLGQLIHDCGKNKATGFAQKEDDRNKYLENFEQHKFIDKSKINNPVLFYRISDGYVGTTKIPSISSSTDDKNSDEAKEEFSTGQEEKKPQETEEKDKEKDKEEVKEENNHVESKDDPKENNIGNKGAKGNDNKANSKEKDGNHSSEHHKNDTTESRSCLIPRNIPYKVTDQRTIDLLEELQNTPIKGHRNLIAIGFRSFIEFSVIVFIEKFPSKYNGNGKTLADKIKHTVDKLEATHGQKTLKNKIPSVYQLVNTANPPTSQFGDIAMFNLFVHHHKFHPNEDGLKVMYNNYEPYIKLLWDEINKK